MLPELQERVTDMPPLELVILAALALVYLGGASAIAAFMVARARATRGQEVPAKAWVKFWVYGVTSLVFWPYLVGTAAATGLLKALDGKAA